MEEQDYFSVGTRDNIVINNSKLSDIDPESNGSPQKFLASFDNQEVEKSYYKMGHLIHKWQEDRKAFKVSEVEKPAEKLGIVADNIIAEVKAGAIFNDELCLSVGRLTGYQKNWKDDTLKKNIVEQAGAYITEVIEAEENNCVYITKRESETVDSCVIAVEKHPVAKNLLFGQDEDFSNKKVYKELEIYWTKEFNFLLPDGQVIVVELFFKAKLDSLCIDFDNKTITYTDPKTTSQGAYGFSKSFEAYKYYRQQAFYNWAIREWAKQNNIDLTGFVFKNYNIVIETSNLFQVTVYEITEDWLEKGKQEYQKLIKRLVEHIATNQWNYSLEEMNNDLVLTIPFKE